MKDSPILFTGPNVRAILDGRKTQTRRVVKLPHNNPLGKWEPTTTGGPGLYKDMACTIPANEPERCAIWHTRTGDLVCPRYALGDRLWVRETWNDFKGVRATENVSIELGRYYYAADTTYRFEPHRPSIFMPRAASRITLEVTGVRVERLQDISVNDAIAEGVAPTRPSIACTQNCPEDYITGYKFLWDSINAKRAPWASNPWVWCVEFKRV